MPSGAGRGRTKLRNIALTPEYRRHLQDASLWILELVFELGGRLSSRSSARRVDRWLERAVEEAHSRGERLYWVKLGLIGVQRAFNLSAPLLRNTWGAFRGWQSRSRTPITFYILEALLLMFLHKGAEAEGQERAEWFSCLVGAWLAFVALLRPGEVMGLKIGDLLFPEDEELSEGVVLVLTINKPKTRRIWPRQFVLVKDQRVIRWLKWWCTDRGRNRSLMRVPRRKWAVKMAAVLSEMHLTEAHYTLASFRSGGATHHFKTFADLASLQYVGRWVRAETLRHYLHEAMAVHTASQASDTARSMIKEARTQVHRLSAPPPRPLKSLLEARND